MTGTASIERRLARLETLIRVLIVAALLGLGLGGLVAAAGPEEVRASSIKLVDSRGKVVAELAIRSDQAGLYVMDQDGKTRAALFHSADATGLYIKDNEEVTRVGIAQFAHGGGGVALHGPESKGATVLYFKESGSLRFFDEAGNVTNAVTAIAR